jgi:hypothetical protein
VAAEIMAYFRANRFEVDEASTQGETVVFKGI